MAGNAVFLLFGLAAISLVVSIGFVVMSISSAGVPGSTSNAATGASTSGDEWIPLRSRAPADILAAARSGPLFHESQTDTADGARDLSRLGTPAFVHALRPADATAAQVPDFYVVPILNEAGAATDAAELALNPSQTAVQEVAIVTYAVPRADGSIAQLQEDQAIQAVTSQRHEAAQAIGHPYLVYFQLDPQQQASQNDQPAWMAGGALPADPIWLVPVTDGEPYLVGTDGMVYTMSQLPQ